MYDPKKRVHFKTSPTVAQLCKYLQENIPLNATVNICGDEQVYIHVEEDGSVVSLDDCSLSDLEEYCGLEVVRIENM